MERVERGIDGVAQRMERFDAVAALGLRWALEAVAEGEHLVCDFCHEAVPAGPALVESSIGYVLHGFYELGRFEERLVDGERDRQSGAV